MRRSASLQTKIEGGGMDATEAIRGRRSVRRYKPDPVSDEALNEVLEAARWAPSWANTQCWRFVVVRDQGTKEKLASTVKPATNKAAAAIREAPVAIVACAELGRSGFYKGEAATDKGDWYMFDTALAMQNLTLAAHAMGLGTVHVGLFEAKEAARVLGLPDGAVVVEMTPLGYPAETPAPTPRKELADIVFKDKYGRK
jgi:nitroreductase